jgi:hypothetical protein
LKKKKFNFFKSVFKTQKQTVWTRAKRKQEMREDCIINLNKQGGKVLLLWYLWEQTQ